MFLSNFTLDSDTSKEKILRNFYRTLKECTSEIKKFIVNHRFITIVSISSTLHMAIDFPTATALIEIQIKMFFIRKLNLKAALKRENKLGAFMMKKLTR